MSATFTERRRRDAGFTMVELIAVMVLLGILSAVALPRLQMATRWQPDAARDGVLSALQRARDTAHSHRRLVCVALNAQGAMVVTIAAANPATGCSQPLQAGDGSTILAGTEVGSPLGISPSSPIYFLPDGTVRTSASAASASDFRVTVAGAGAVTIVGDTGLIE